MIQREVEIGKKKLKAQLGREFSLPVFPSSLSPGRKDLLCGIILLIMVALLYGHTLHAPWYFDDSRNIFENIYIRNPINFLKKVPFLVQSRWPAQLTFAFNYAIHGFQIGGYHLVNILIHLLSSFLVYLLCKRIFPKSYWLSVFGSLIFLAHPLQTQAITYIVQRQSSLAGLFFLLAIYLYARFREVSAKGGNEPQNSKYLFYGFSVVAGILAVQTKQNTAILPFAILLFDRYFLSPRIDQKWNWRRQVLLILPYFLAPAWEAYRQVLHPMLGKGRTLGTIGTSQAGAKASPLAYFVTELSVLWLYLRLLFFPVHQALHYDVPIVSQYWTLQNALAFAGLIGLLAGALLSRKKFPWLSFGILWFLLTLSVESTFLPLDTVFEHRLYLPMFGFSVAVIGMTSKILKDRRAIWVLMAVVLVISVLTWKRNALWGDEIAFFEDNAARISGNERVYSALVQAYGKQEKFDKAETVVEKLLMLPPKNMDSYVNMSSLYLEKGEVDKADAIIKKAQEKYPGRVSPKLLNNTGNVFQQNHQLEKALETYNQALEMTPHDPMILVNIGMVLEEMGLSSEAEGFYRRAVQENPQFDQAYVKWSASQFRKDRFPEAISLLKTALKINPNNVEALFSLGYISLRHGDPADSRKALDALRSMDSARAQKLEESMKTGRLVN